MKRNEIRIIGGKWRSRKIFFPDNPALRPTSSRVRETLFNWLAPYIVNARCLDLFSGSGILGFEALSRGAVRSVFVEKDPKTAIVLRENAKLLNADAIEVIQKDVCSWLQEIGSTFDIVFLDPPYQAKLLPNCFALLEEQNWLCMQSFIYFESDVPILRTTLPSSWQLLKEKKAGQVYYYLAKKS